MTSYIFVFIISFFVVIIITPLVIIIAKKIGAIDISKKENDNENRRMHDTPIPKLGGIGIFIGYSLALISYVLYIKIFKNIVFDPKILGYFIGSFIIMCVCIVDDIKPIKPLTKLIRSTCCSNNYNVFQRQN